ncbi:unnamed protein product, partial [Musa hybrid cultivar]
MPGQSPEAKHIRDRNKNHCSYQSGLLMISNFFLLLPLSQALILLIQRQTLRPARSKSSSLPPSFRSSSPNVHLQQRYQTTADFTARVQISLPSLPPSTASPRMHGHQCREWTRRKGQGRLPLASGGVCGQIAVPRRGSLALFIRR